MNYTAKNGTLTFAAGEVEKTVEVAARTDTAQESEETVEVAALVDAARESAKTFTSRVLEPARDNDRRRRGRRHGGDAEADPPALKPASLTASFTGVPAAHDGETAFSFELRFSENFPGRFRFKTLRDEALQVTNGRVTGVKRVVRGQFQRWTITVEPALSGDVTVTLPAAADCAATGAICTEAGEKLSKAASATIAFASGAPAAARFESAATDEAGRGLWLTFTKDNPGRGRAYGLHGAGRRRAPETRAASWEDNRVALVLTEPVRAGQTITVAYAKPSGAA